MINQQHKNTICALATAKGSGAIAVIRLSGEEAIQITDVLFKARSGKALKETASHTAVFGDFYDGDEVLDEVLITLFKAPKSYTGETSVEISCHGSLYIQNRILELLIGGGARMAEAGEFTKRAFLNGKLDLSQAEGVADLIASESRAMQQISIQHLKGGISDELKQIRKKILDFSALIELELDFSEEDVEFADRDAFKGLLKEVSTLLHSMIHSFSYGNAIKNGFNVAIVGAPNVGKSTLLNRLLKENRAIISDIAGTTRDAIEDTMVIDGVCFRFIDTAGIRQTSDEIESIGIQITYETIKKSHFVLLLIDTTDVLENSQEQHWHQIISDIKKDLTPEQELLLIFNKIDCLDEAGLLKVQQAFSDENACLFISAKENKGISELEQHLILSTQKDNYDNQTVISNLRHLEALKESEKAVARIEEAIRLSVPTDLLAMDIKDAVYHLGCITGEISNDEVLGHIFKNFCIGK